MYGFGMIKGLTITLKNFVLPSRQFTVHQYPNRKIGLVGLAKRAETNPISYLFKEPKLAAKALAGFANVEDRQDQHPRFRGEEFSWYEERCTGCASCAKYCPLGIIRIVTHPSGDLVEEGQKYALDVFDIDIGRCMFCGLCVEACPYDALHMGSGFEEGTYSRRDLVINKERLVNSPRFPSTWFRPQLESKHYDAHESPDAPWRDVGRHQRPTTEDQENNWGKR